MGVTPPFLYDPVKSGSTRTFDPKSVSRNSATPSPPRHKQSGPLVSFNQHPDSFLVLPYGNTNVTPMNPSVKTWVKWMRISQIVSRCLELIVSAGLLVMMILVRGMDAPTAWIMRIMPGVAILHTIYSIYHLSHSSGDKSPASSAAYMLFASLFDGSAVAIYAFSALIAKSRISEWTTVLSNQDLLPLLGSIVFYGATVGGGLYLVSFILSLSLAITFRKISNLPPDMNPLEDNLTSRHKRNKSELSTSTTMSEKRMSTPLESIRSSGAAYEDLSKPPTVPFFHTRSGSTDSFSAYKSTPSRDSRLDLPSRQYQIESARSSMADLKRASYYDPSPPKRTSYNPVRSSDISSYNGSVLDMKNAPIYGQSTLAKTASYSEIPLSDTTTPRTSRTQARAAKADQWFTRDSLPKRDSLPSGRDSPISTRSRTSSPKKVLYTPLHQPPPLEEQGLSYNPKNNLPNPLEANPPTPRHSARHSYKPSRDSPLAEISNNRTHESTLDSSDITDSRLRDDSPDLLQENQNDNIIVDNFRNSKQYGDLRPGTPPIMVGGRGGRQVSSGTDLDLGEREKKGRYRRDVSGKIAEEGRGGDKWRTRFRKISGKN